MSASTSPAAWRARLWRAVVTTHPATGAQRRAAVDAAEPRPAGVTVATALEIVAAAVAHRARVRAARATVRTAPPRHPVAACRPAGVLVSLARRRALLDLGTVTGADEVEGRAGPATWRHAVVEDWTRYSKSWHRAHGPARTVRTTLTVDADLARRTPRKVRGQHGGLITLWAQPQPPLPSIWAQVYRAEWLVPRSGKHATVSGGILLDSPHGVIHAATVMEATALLHRREALAAAAERRQAEGAAGEARRARQRAQAVARAEAARQRAAEAAAWWVGWATPPPEAADVLTAVGRQPTLADVPVTLQSSERAGNCRDGSLAFAASLGAPPACRALPVRMVLAGAAQADMDTARRAVAACAVALGLDLN